MNIGAVIKKYRKEAGITQEEMANRLDEHGGLAFGGFGTQKIENILCLKPSFYLYCMGL